MGISELVARQLRDPHGPFGRLVMAPLLNHGNDEVISAGLAALDLEDEDRFLDVGFGGGVSFAKAARVIERGRMFGVDPSEDMVTRAKSRFRRWVREGRLELQVGGVDSLPFAPHSIDKLLTANTIYFWPEIRAGLSACIDVLAPGGRLAIAFSDAPKMRRFSQVTRHGFRLVDSDDVVKELNALDVAGVRKVRLYGRRTFGDVVVVAEAR